MTSSNIALLFQHRIPNSFKSSKTLFDIRHISSAGPPRHECEGSLYSLPPGNRGAEARSPLFPLKARVFPLNGKWRRYSPGGGKWTHLGGCAIYYLVLCRGFEDELHPAYIQKWWYISPTILSDARRNPFHRKYFFVIYT